MEMGTREQPVTIVGAGLAGLTAAVILAGQGRDASQILAEARAASRTALRGR